MRTFLALWKKSEEQRLLDTNGVPLKLQPFPDWSITFVEATTRQPCTVHAKNRVPVFCLSLQAESEGEVIRYYGRGTSFHVALAVVVQKIVESTTFEDAFDYQKCPEIFKDTWGAWEYLKNHPAFGGRFRECVRLNCRYDPKKKQVDAVLDAGMAYIGEWSPEPYFHIAADTVEECVRILAGKVSYVFGDGDIVMPEAFQIKYAVEKVAPLINDMFCRITRKGMIQIGVKRERHPGSKSDMCLGAQVKEYPTIEHMLIELADLAEEREGSYAN